VAINQILKQLEVLQPLEKSIRDYVIIGDSIYIAPENLDKTQTESKVALPDKRENYCNRIVEKGLITHFFHHFFGYYCINIVHPIP